MSSPRSDYFQTDAHVTLIILKRNVELSTCSVGYTNGEISVKTGEEILFEGKLAGEVDKDNFSVKCTPSKVEVTMPKKQFGRWPSLLSASSSDSAVKFGTKDWNAIEKEAIEEEEKAKLDGNDAVNKMFKNIYANASDDVKKAMIKSYSESGGTVLSTNWAEISQKKTEIKPPDSMEYKQF